MTEIIDVKELEEGTRIEGTLAIKDKKAVRSYEGGNFFTLELGNRTGKIMSKYWGGERSEVQKEYEKLAVGDVVRVKGNIGEYRGEPEISLNPSRGNVLEKVSGEDYDPKNFLPRIDENPEHFFSAISRKIRNMENEYLRALCLKFYGDLDIASKLKEMPAAKSYHHNKIGGYMQHVHETMQLAETFCKQHPEIERELLLTGVFLHDIGKLKEYKYKTAIDFTEDGRLLGHIPIGDSMITKAIEEIDDFPERLGKKIRHMVLSHHGQREWGSAVEPRTKEAIVLHELEYLDSKVSKVIETFKKYEKSKESGVFDPGLNQYIYLD